MSTPAAINCAMQALNSAHDMFLRLSVIAASPSRNGAHGVAELEASLVQLGFAVADGAIQHGGDFVMLVAFDVVEHEYEPVTGGQVRDGALQRETVDGTGQRQVGGAKAAARALFRRWLHGFV